MNANTDSKLWYSGSSPCDLPSDKDEELQSSSPPLAKGQVILQHYTRAEKEKQTDVLPSVSETAHINASAQLMLGCKLCNVCEMMMASFFLRQLEASEREYLLKINHSALVLPLNGKEHQDCVHRLQ